MSGYEITCANRNHRGVIIRVGGSGWSLTTYDAILKISTSQIQLGIFVEGEFKEIGVRGEGSDAYLVIDASDFPLHNLDSLQSCGSSSFQ